MASSFSCPVRDSLKSDIFLVLTGQQLKVSLAFYCERHIVLPWDHVGLIPLVGVPLPTIAPHPIPPHPHTCLLRSHFLCATHGDMRRTPRLGVPHSNGRILGAVGEPSCQTWLDPPAIVGQARRRAKGAGPRGSALLEERPPLRTLPWGKKPSKHFQANCPCIPPPPRREAPRGRRQGDASKIA